MENCWELSAHVHYTTIAVNVMNLCQFGPGQFMKYLARYIKVLETIKGPGPVHNMVKHLYFNPEPLLRSMTLTSLTDLHKDPSDSG